MRCTVVFSIACTLAAVACSDTWPAEPEAAGQDTPQLAEHLDALATTWTAEHVGPASGFVASVRFAPGSGSQLWISGDDASGLYQSVDGGQTIIALPKAPLDWSAYAIATRGARLVAPNYFGRGVAISDDLGRTWRVVTAGLPQGAGEARKIYDATITGAGHILVATGSGLYRSTTGQSFSRVTAGLSTATAVTRLLPIATGYLAGSANGRLYSSADGATWIELSTADGSPICDLAVGAQGIYVASYSGLVVRLPTAGAPQVIANPLTDARFATSLWTKISVAPRGAVDRIYLGTVGFATNRAAAKLLVSDDGGATFVARGAGLGGASIFSIAIDPFDVNHAVVGTVGDGMYWTRNGGVSWTATRGDLRATSALGFAQDPADPEHWLMVSSEGLPGTPSLFERRATGWTRQGSLLADSIALTFAGGLMLAAPMEPGAPVRVATSAAGPWVDVPSRAGRALRWVSTSRGLYAVGAVLERLVGSNFAVALAAPMSDATELPSPGGATIVACGLGMVASASGSFADATALPAPPRPWLTCRFDAAGRLLATGGGELWMAPSLAAARTAAGWSRVVTPLDGAELVSVLPHGARWWLGGGFVDVGARAGATSGLYYTEDRGATWIAAHAAMTPSRTVWQLHPGRDEHEVFAALWGGGLWRLRDR